MSSWVLAIGMSRALAGAPGPDDGAPVWVAPPAQSAFDGEYGVQFVPRYPDPITAERRRQHDLRSFASALPSMASGAQQSAAQTLAARLDAVKHWQEQLLARSGDPSLPQDARVSVLHQLDLLAMEEVTLRAQVSMLGAGVGSGGSLRRAARQPHDLVSFGQDIEVAPDDEVHDAVAFGGDVIVRGRVVGDAVSFGGDVRIREAGTVDGDVESFGGSVAHMPLISDPGSPRSVVRRVRAEAHAGPVATAVGEVASGVGLSGLALVLSALLPARVATIGESARTRPLPSLVLGVLGLLAGTTTGVLLAVTVLGIPLALGLALVMAGVLALGATAAAAQVGERLRPGDASAGSRVVVGALALVALTWVPWVGAPLVGAAALTGAGSTLLTRFGRPAA